MVDYESLRPFDLAIVLAALLVSLAVGCALSRTNKDSDAFFMAGRSMPGWAVGVSMMATIISAMTFLALPGFSYIADWRWMATCLVYPLALIPAIRWFMPFFRRGHVRSAYEYLEQRFGPWARAYVASGFVLTQGLRMGIILYATSLALEVMLGIDRTLMIFGMGLIVVAYCTAGGLRAVIWTDVVQGVGLMLGAALVVPLVCSRLPGGAGQLMSEAIAAGKTSLGPVTLRPQELSFWAIVVSHLVIYTQWSCTDQMFIQRYCAPSDLREARRTLYIGMLLTVPIWAYFIVVGTTLWAFYKHFPDSDLAGLTAEQVFPRFIATQVPPGISGLLATAVCLAAMSTLSSSINATAATIEVDFYRRFLVKGAADRHYLVVGRLVTVAFGAVMIAIALVIHSVRSSTLQELQAIMVSIFGSGLLGLFLLGFATRTSSGAAGTATLLTIGLIVGWLALAQFEGTQSWMPHELWLGVAANLFLFVTALCWDVGRKGLKSRQKQSAPRTMFDESLPRATVEAAAVPDTTG